MPPHNQHPTHTLHKDILDELYARYNRRKFIHPDPLEFLYLYEDPLDREVAGMIASALAYGRVAQILRSVGSMLDRMGTSPARFIRENSPSCFEKAFDGFRHRFTSGVHVALLCACMKRVLERYGSLEACFIEGLQNDDSNILPALATFVQELNVETGQGDGMLLPSPAKGSACKRLNLFLRWMVRSDDVDPGGWHRVRPSMLVVPLDTHMHRIGMTMGLTRRKQADMRAALEITHFFRSILPEDPVRYDFALTRLGIRDSMNSNELFAELTGSIGLPGD